MPKAHSTQKKSDPLQAAKVKLTAHNTGVSIRQVQRVIRGDQHNEEVLCEYMTIDEGVKNLLKKEVNRIVPIS